jgi:uncharacterized protein (UPF0548 family)
MDLTYAEVGATRPGSHLPDGYHHVHRRARLGEGQATFTAAVAGLRSWRMYREAGIAVRTEAPAVAEGADLATGMGVGPLRLWAPCRVVWVVDTPTRFGYGLGTLPGHPVSGEESFLVSLDGGRAVQFAVTTFSRPAAWYQKLAGPLGRLGQEFVYSRYLTGMRRLVGNPR